MNQIQIYAERKQLHHKLMELFQLYCMRYKRDNTFDV